MTFDPHETRVVIRPGPLDVETADLLTTIVNQVREGIPRGTPPQQPAAFSGGVQTADLIPDFNINNPFRAVITDLPDVSGFFSWDAVDPIDVGVWDTAQIATGGINTNGGEEFAVSPCYEANNKIVDIGTIVQLRRAFLDSQMGWVYVFDAPGEPVWIGKQTSTASDANGLWQFTLERYTSTAAIDGITVDVVDVNNVLSSTTAGSYTSLIPQDVPSESGNPLFATASIATSGGGSGGVSGKTAIGQQSTTSAVGGFWQQTLQNYNSTTGLTPSATTVDVVSPNNVFSSVTVNKYFGLVNTGLVSSHGNSLYIAVDSITTAMSGGSLVGARPAFNFIGTSNNLTLTVQDDIADNRINITGESYLQVSTSTGSGAGTLVSTRPELNFISAGATTITVADNSGQGRADITISSTASGVVFESISASVSGLVTLSSGSPTTVATLASVSHTATYLVGFNLTVFADMLGRTSTLLVEINGIAGSGKAQSWTFVADATNQGPTFSFCGSTPIALINADTLTLKVTLSGPSGTWKAVTSGANIADFYAVYQG